MAQPRPRPCPVFCNRFGTGQRVRTWGKPLPGGGGSGWAPVPGVRLRRAIETRPARRSHYPIAALLVGALAITAAAQSGSGDRNRHVVVVSLDGFPAYALQ